MGRNRVIYQSEALYVSKNIGSTGSGDHVQLRRVQSANYNFSIERQDVNQFGQLARIDSLVLASPTVSLDLSYYPNDGFNEKALGFYVKTGSLADGNFASGQMGNSSGQNFYIITTDEGVDLNTSTQAAALSGKKTIAIGNAFLSNYTFEASVGNLPTASVTLEGLNVRSSIISGTTGNVVGGADKSGNVIPSGNAPSIDPGLGTAYAGVSGAIQLSNPIEATGTDYGPSALRPGDITINFGDYTNNDSVTGAAPLSISTGNIDPFHIQSFSLNLPLSRSPIERLGSKFAFARVVDFPIVATFNVNAVVNEIQARNLSQMLDDNSKRTITVTINTPSAGNALKWEFKGSQLQSESFSSSIGANKTVDLVFQTQIGGPSDTNNGIYLSGSFKNYGNLKGTERWGY